MSITDAEIMGLSAVGYDQFAAYDDITDSDLLSDNRAHRTGEVRDRLYPSSNFRGGWELNGSGPVPDFTDVSTYASQLSSPIAPNPPGRNVSANRNPRLRGTIGEVAKAAKKLRKKEKFQESEAPNETPLNWWQNLWSPENQTSNLMILVFVLLICIIVMQGLQNQRLHRSLNMFMIHSLYQRKKD